MKDLANQHQSSETILKQMEGEKWELDEVCLNMKRKSRCFLFRRRTTDDREKWKAKYVRSRWKRKQKRRNWGQRGFFSDRCTRKISVTVTVRWRRMLVVPLSLENSPTFSSPPSIPPPFTSGPPSIHPRPSTSHPYSVYLPPPSMHSTSIYLTSSLHFPIHPSPPWHHPLPAIHLSPSTSPLSPSPSTSPDKLRVTQWLND